MNYKIDKGIIIQVKHIPAKNYKYRKLYELITIADFGDSLDVGTSRSTISSILMYIKKNKLDFKIITRKIQEGTTFYYRVWKVEKK